MTPNTVALIKAGAVTFFAAFIMVSFVFWPLVLTLMVPIAILSGVFMMAYTCFSDDADYHDDEDL